MLQNAARRRFTCKQFAKNANFCYFAPSKAVAGGEVQVREAPEDLRDEGVRRALVLRGDRDHPLLPWNSLSLLCTNNCVFFSITTRVSLIEIQSFPVDGFISEYQFISMSRDFFPRRG